MTLSKPLCRFPLALAVAAAVCCRAAASELITLCGEDQDNYPWITQHSPSYIPIMLEIMEQRMGVHFALVSKPWKRCLAELQLNVVDGVVNASFLVERTSLGVFPMRGDQPDVRRRMLMSRYSLYRIRGSAVGWDGMRLTNLDGTIGAQTSFSIVPFLRGLGAKVDDSSKGGGDILRKLVLGGYGAVALQTENGDRLIAQNPEFRELVEKLPVPIVEKPYYLMLSKRFVKANPQLAERIWDEVAEVRESAEFAERVAQTMGK